MYHGSDPAARPARAEMINDEIAVLRGWRFGGMGCSVPHWWPETDSAEDEARRIDVDDMPLCRGCNWPRFDSVPYSSSHVLVATLLVELVSAGTEAVAVAWLALMKAK